MLTPAPCTRAVRRRARSFPGGRTLAALVFVWVSLGLLPSGPLQAQANTSYQGYWPSLQGGPEHLGVSTDGPAPPLKRAWRQGAARADSRLSGVALVPGLAVATGVHSLVGLDPVSGAVLWSVDRAQGPLVSPAIEATPGNPGGVIVYSEGSGADSGIVGLDLATHQRRWRVSLTAPALGAPVVADGHVFVGVRDRSVVSIDVETGAVAWTARTEATVDTSPAVEGGRVFAVSESASSGRARVYALDETTGRIEWTYSPGHVAIHVSSPTVDTGRVYIGMGDFRVVAFDAASGAVRWSSSVRGDFTYQSAAALSGGSLYIADQEGGLYRFDSQTGRRRWDYQFTSFMTRGSPLVIGNVVLQGLDNGTLAAVEVGEGHLVWRMRFTTGQVGPLTPAGRLLLAPVIGSKGGVYGLAHDPSAALIDVPSPSHLDLAAAALNYAASFIVVLALVLLLFRLVLRRGRGMHDDPSPSASGAVAVDS